MDDAEMSDPSNAAAEHLCASDALQERGDGVRFDVQYGGQLTCAFALRVEGVVHAYLNRCAHVAMEMDWQPGKFLDSSQRYILCATHGAAYEPDTGRCVAGPCNGARLTKLQVSEAQGEVTWYPTSQIRPIFAA
jgi:nitrite reductase/ring-hydroxylating ferredoxin subunit